MGCGGSTAVHVAELTTLEIPPKAPRSVQQSRPRSNSDGASAGEPSNTKATNKVAPAPPNSAPPTFPTPKTNLRRLSLAGGPVGTKAIISPIDDSKRRRLSQTATSAAEARTIVAENNQVRIADPNNDPNRPSIRVGECTHLPIRWAEYSRPGNDPMKRIKENQDSCTVVVNYGGKTDQVFFGVFDGHGSNGGHASRFVKDNLHELWLRSGDIDADPFACMARGCLHVNDWLARGDIDVFVSGTTGIMTLMRNNHLYIANVGDSRAVLGRLAGSAIKALDLSSDHKPDRPDEMARILGLGGRVYEWGVPRVWLKHVDMPGLAMSRSFGDLAAKTVGVLAEPELSEVYLGENDRFLIWASDGVWEFISSQEAAEIVWENFDKGPLEAAAALVKESTLRWKEEEDVVDDTTCIVAFLTFSTSAEVGFSESKQESGTLTSQMSSLAVSANA